mmetsp:Transcript_29140/g.89091  ORF Transcript_29140/g.89091 Transcript_29140/m.89091 type:complete len:207 (+) Transcript_29140:1477-2097(+)
MSPRRAFATNALSSSADGSSSAVAFLRCFSISVRASPKKPARPRRARSVALAVSSFLVESWNVDGSIPGNQYSATGSSSSRNGTTTKTANGTTLNRSAVVLSSCLRSRRVSVRPVSSRCAILDDVRTSNHSSFVPIQYCRSVSLKCVHCDAANSTMLLFRCGGVSVEKRRRCVGVGGGSEASFLTLPPDKKTRLLFLRSSSSSSCT